MSRSRIISNEKLFTDYNGELVAPLPYKFENGLFFNFLVPGSMDRMQDLCDKWFNKPSRFAFEVSPVMPYIVVTFVYYPKAYPSTLDPQTNGFMTYKEMIFSMYVETKRDFWTGRSKVYGFIPYLLLDHPRAISAGREAFGMPKALGKVSFPEGTNDPAKENAFTLDGFSIPQFGNKRNFESKDLPLFRIHCPPSFSVHKYLEAESQGMNTLTNEIYGKLNADSGMSMDQSRKLTHINQANSITLFQLRDFRDPERAMHQAILEYQARNVTMAFGGSLNYDFEVEFPVDTDLFPIRETLGMTKRVVSAFWYRMNFEFVLGKELWNGNNPMGFVRDWFR